MPNSSTPALFPCGQQALLEKGSDLSRFETSQSLSCSSWAVQTLRSGHQSNSSFTWQHSVCLTRPATNFDSKQGLSARQTRPFASLFWAAEASCPVGEAAPWRLCGISTSSQRNASRLSEKSLYEGCHGPVAASTADLCGRTCFKDWFVS